MLVSAFVYFVGLKESTSGRDDTKHIKTHYWLPLEWYGPDWLWILQQPAQICDAVAGMESQHAAAGLIAKGPAWGKQGTMPGRLAESISLSNAPIPFHILMPMPMPPLLSGSLLDPFSVSIQIKPDWAGKLGSVFNLKFIESYLICNQVLIREAVQIFFKIVLNWMQNMKKIFLSSVLSL